jgi:hypothetical protein
MKFFNKLIVSLFVISTSYIGAQTPGFNYQAIILNNAQIQIPGSDIKENQVPLGLEKVVLRFTIENEKGIEYIEEHPITTDENGMISLIVGEGTPISSNFSAILWDGKLKYLNVEINILNSNKGFVLLDNQKILYIPHPTQGSNVKIVDTIGDLNPPYKKGDLIWVKSFGLNKNPTLMIWDGANWVPVSDDYDPTNELGLLVATNNADRDTKIPSPKTGDQVWNKICGCIQIFNATSWVDIGQDIGKNIAISNGLTKTGNLIEFGGLLTKPTEVTTNSSNTLSIKGLEPDVLNDQNEIVVVNSSTGVLKKVATNSLVKVEVILIVASNGQKRFSVPFSITIPQKINVYRNGVRIDFIPVNNTTIELESEAICYQKDEIRIVQFY